jgi:hypothetical protein
MLHDQIISSKQTSSTYIVKSDTGPHGSIPVSLYNSAHLDSTHGTCVCVCVGGEGVRCKHSYIKQALIITVLIGTNVKLFGFS